MKVAFFDLDGTLLDGDTDVMWSGVLTSKGVFTEADAAEFQRAYSSGQMDAEAFVSRFLSPIKLCGLSQCEEWRDETLREHLIPKLSERMRVELEAHRERGHELVMATATNEFLVRPVAAHLGIRHVLASPAERGSEGYTGARGGLACFRKEKLRRAEAWLNERGHDWSSSETWFYSDSRHDLPLLGAVSHPFVVSPDEELTRHARQHSWPEISLHSNDPTSSFDKPIDPSESDAASD